MVRKFPPAIPAISDERRVPVDRTDEVDPSGMNSWRLGFGKENRHRCVSDAGRSVEVLYLDRGDLRGHSGVRGSELERRRPTGVLVEVSSLRA